MKCIGCNGEFPEYGFAGTRLNVVTESNGFRFRRWYGGGSLCTPCLERIERKEAKLWVSLCPVRKT